MILSMEDSSEDCCCCSFDLFAVQEWTGTAWILVDDSQD